MTSGPDLRPQFAAKLAAPELQSPVLRADQLERVAHAAGVRLLLVRAPAGYGKTTLVAAAAAELGWKYVWYRLDPLDADPHLFLAALGRALDAGVPDSGGGRPDPPTTAVRPQIAEAAAGLAAELERVLDGELYLVLDGYETLAGETAFNEALAALLTYLPDAAHLVLLSRVRPTFPISKLALEGELAEIGSEQLRFDTAQLTEVAERSGDAALTRDAAKTLLDHTEGWPAGALFALSASRGPGLHELNGDVVEHAVRPYLEEQIYARLDAPAQDFLRRTWCLDSMSAQVAEAVSGTPDAGRLLKRLERDGALTFADAGSYRVHGLLRRFLRDEVAAEGGLGAVHALQMRAADALVAQGSAGPAIDLYLDAGEPEATVRVLREQGYRLLEGSSEALLSRWSAALAGAGLPGWATLLEGRLYFLTGDLTAARSRLEAAVVLLDDDPRGRYLALRPLSKCCSIAGQDDDAVTYARQSVEASADGERADSLRDLALDLSLACRWTELEEAQTAFSECGVVPGELAAGMMVTRAHSAYGSGDMRAALSAGELALPAVRRDASVWTLGTVLIGLAGFNFYLCRYARGAPYLEEARRVLNPHGPLYARAQVDAVQATFLAQQGRLRECLKLVDDLAADPLTRTNAGVLGHAYLVAATTLRRAGEPERAVQWCRRAAELMPAGTTAYDRVDIPIDLAAAEGLCGAPRHAVARLLTLRREAAVAGLRFQDAKAGFFHGALLLRSGEDDGELARSAGDLLRLGHLDFLGQELVACPEAAARLCGEDVSNDDLRELLRVSALQVGGSALVATLAGRGERVLALALSLARTDLPAREATLLVQALRRQPSKEVRDRARRLDLGAGALVTRLFLELTPREEEILALLAEGYSNEQVARRLVLSVGTVKTHVHRILAKTGTGGRLAAAMLYRQRATAAGEGERGPS